MLPPPPHATPASPRLGNGPHPKASAAPIGTCNAAAMIVTIAGVFISPAPRNKELKVLDNQKIKLPAKITSEYWMAAAQGGIKRWAEN